MIDVIRRNNVRVRGSGARAMMFAHGFGCDQNMWRLVAPAFEPDFRTVLFDHVGAGGSDLSAYDKTKYSSLAGYADDVVEIGRALTLQDAVFVGHSVSSMIGVLAAEQAPGMFGKLVLIGPSARYIDDLGYVGGFSAAQIEELLQFLESNHMGWSAQMAPVIMGNPDRPELGEELTNSFCRTDPEIAKAFARVTFTSDNRDDLAQGHCPYPGITVQRGHHRFPGGRGFRPSRHPRKPHAGPGGDRPLPELERPGRSHLCDANLRVNAAVESPSNPDFQDLIDNAPCGYITLLPSGRIAHVNGTFLNWSGYAAHEMVGKRLSDFLSIAGRIYYETHIAPLLRMQGTFEEFAIDVRKSNGEPLQMIANANEKRSTDGKPLSIRLALIRATDRRRYEHELLVARELARDAEKVTDERLQRERETAELREQFIAVLGHDLRNPLGSIVNGAHVLDRTVQTVKEHQVIAMMQTAAMRMAGLIDDVLDLARGRLGGGISLNRDSHKPLEPVLTQVVDELRHVSPGHVIDAVFTIDQPVNCDRARLGQLLSNLLGNALTHGAGDKPVVVRASTGDGSFELWVANSGEMIPEASMAQLFQPFFRGKARASKQGLGLGLYIASEIARAHGGELTASSTPEETRFTFTMRLD